MSSSLLETRECDQDTIQPKPEHGTTIKDYKLLNCFGICLLIKLYQQTQILLAYLHPFKPSDGIDVVISKLENWLSNAGVL